MSILDSTSSQIEAMKARVGGADRVRLELFLDSVREVEKKLGSTSVAACPEVSMPFDYDPAVAEDFSDYLDTASDLLVLALQCQVTPVTVFQLSRGNNGMRSGVAGVQQDQHGVSHYASAGTLEQHRSIVRFYADRQAHFLRRLSEVDELGTPLLDSVVTLYGSGIADADAHDGANCPILLAGGRNHGILTDRVIDHGLGNKAYGEGTPLANLYVGLAELAGMELTAFGNSTGAIDLLG